MYMFSFFKKVAFSIKKKNPLHFNSFFSIFIPRHMKHAKEYIVVCRGLYYFRLSVRPSTCSLVCSLSVLPLTLNDRFSKVSGIGISQQPVTHQKAFIFGLLAPWRVCSHFIRSRPRVHLLSLTLLFVLIFFQACLAL